MLVRAEDAEDCALFSTDEELNLSVVTTSLRIKGSDREVGEVVTIVGGAGDDKADEELDLTRGKKCFKRVEGVYNGA